MHYHPPASPGRERRSSNQHRAKPSSMNQLEVSPKTKEGTTQKLQPETTQAKIRKNHSKRTREKNPTCDRTHNFQSKNAGNKTLSFGNSRKHQKPPAARCTSTTL